MPQTSGEPGLPVCMFGASWGQRLPVCLDDCCCRKLLALGQHPTPTPLNLPRSEAGALAPLLQLLHVGSQLAGGERRTAIAALQALEPLAAEPGCRAQLVEPCVRWGGRAGRQGG